MPRKGVIQSNLAIIYLVSGATLMTLAPLPLIIRTKLGKGYGVYTLSLGTKF
jgi:hypothetical protein